VRVCRLLSWEFSFQLLFLLWDIILEGEFGPKSLLFSRHRCYRLIWGISYRCFNCARDFGPRLVALMAGWGGQLFREYHAWWVWGPWCADISGALFGALIYDLAIFTGGESPINYPPRRRKRALRVRKLNLRKKLGLGPRKKTKDLEKSVSEVNS
jgi:hypothetical protein